MNERNNGQFVFISPSNGRTEGRSGRTDGWIDGRTDERTGGTDIWEKTDGVEGRTDGQMDGSRIIERKEGWTYG